MSVEVLWSLGGAKGGVRRLVVTLTVPSAKSEVILVWLRVAGDEPCPVHDLEVGRESP